MANQLQWINVLSTRPSLEAALTEVVERVQQTMSTLPDLGIVFISSAYASEYSRLLPLLLDRLPLPIIIGCGGGGIVGVDGEDRALEVEAHPAISLSVAKLPEVDITPFHILPEDLPDLDSSPSTWVNLIGVEPQTQPQFILLGEPFSARINDFLEGLDFAYPGATKIGGLSSASSIGIANSLFFHQDGKFGDFVRQQGIVGLALSGNILIETIVAQGCRPIGQPYQVTEGERNIIIGLARDNQSVAPLDLLRDLIQTLSDRDRTLVQHSLFVGIARDEFKLELAHGDFLIRNLLGVDPTMGAIAIGDRVRPGQRIQFHLRDAQTSAEDLELLLQAYQKNQSQSSNYPLGVLMFSCLGRGQGLYGVPNFDSGLIRRYFQSIPVGGFFCNGEIGPVGGTTFLHGYTSAVGIIREKTITQI